MPRIFIKPVVWNPAGYRRPAGVKATSGYPAKYGFGHEEWNNSAKNIFIEDGQSWRTFHVEGLGAFDTRPHAGQICIFMIASTKGAQHLVGIAAEAAEIAKPGRHLLVRKLGLVKRWRDAWSLESVRGKFQNDQARFLRKWRREIDWLPNWKCPVSGFWRPREPIPLDARAITGRKKLTLRYSSYQEIDVRTAVRILEFAGELKRCRETAGED